MVHFYYRICIFLVGAILGIFIGKSCINIEKVKPIYPYDVWFKKQELFRKSGSWDILRYKKINYKSVIEADFLFKKVTILCIILLKNKKYMKPINETWANGCNAVTFVDIEKKKTIPIKRNAKDSSWVALCQALQVEYNNYDWLLITSDLTFVIMENLRYFLASLHPEQTYYLGHTVEFWKTYYNKLQSGIVLSGATVNTFKRKISKEDCLSFSYWNREDYYLGKCLAALNITPSDTRDANGLSVFYPHNLNSLIFHAESSHITSKFPVKCCSKHTISFEAIDGDKMYTYYYLLYTVQLFTEGSIGNVPNSQKDDDLVWKKFLKQRNITNHQITSAEYYKAWENLIDDPTSFAAKMKREAGDDL